MSEKFKKSGGKIYYDFFKEKVHKSPNLVLPQFLVKNFFDF